MKLILRLIFALSMLFAVLAANDGVAWDKTDRKEWIAKLMWEFAKNDAIVTTTIGPAQKTDAEENHRYQKFVAEVIPQIAAQPQNHAIIYQTILKLSHLGPQEISAFFAIWFDEVLNRAFTLRTDSNFGPEFPQEDVRWMQNLNRLNRALASVLVTYHFEIASPEENDTFKQVLNYLLADEHLFKADKLSVSQVHLGLTIIHLASDDVQKEYRSLVKELVGRHPNRAVRLLGISQMFYHLKPYDSFLESLWTNYRWQKEFWFDFNQAPEFVYDLLAYHLNITSSNNSTINKHMAQHLWKFLLPGLMLPRWLPPGEISPDVLTQGHFNVYPAELKRDDEDGRKIDLTSGDGEEDWANATHDGPEKNKGKDRKEDKESLRKRWEHHLQILKALPERSIFYWHIGGDLISIMYNLSTKVFGETSQEDLRAALDIFNQGLHHQLRQRNVMHLKGKIVKVLHTILLQHPAWQAFCAQENIVIPDTLPIEALGVWQRQIHPRLKNGAPGEAEIRTWYEFLTDTPENPQKLFEQILGLRPYYRFMGESDQGSTFIRALAEFIAAEKVFTLADGRQLLSTLQTAITTATSEAQADNELNPALASKKAAYSTPTYLTELGHQLNLIWFPKETIIGPGRYSPYLLPQELQTVLNMLRPYRATLLPLFSAVDRRNQIVLDDNLWESNFIQFILPNIFTTRANFIRELTAFTRLSELSTPHGLKLDELENIIGTIEPLFNRTKHRLGQKSYTYNLGSFLVHHLDDAELSALLLRLSTIQVGQPSLQQYWSAFEMSLLNAAITERSTPHPQHDLFLLRFLAIAQDTTKPLANRLEALWHIFYLKQKADLKKADAAKSALYASNIQLDAVVREAVKYLQNPTTVDNFLAEVKASSAITLYEFTSLLIPAFMYFSKENGRTSVFSTVTKILRHADDDLSLLPGNLLEHPPQGIDRQLLAIETLANIFQQNKFNLHSFVQLVTFALNSDQQFGHHEKIKASELFVLAVVRKFITFLRKGNDRHTILNTIERFNLRQHPNRLMRLYAQLAYWADPNQTIGLGDQASWESEIEIFLKSVLAPQDTDLRLRVKLIAIHDLFLIRPDFRKNFPFIMKAIFVRLVQTQPQVNVRTMARIGSALGGALYNDLTTCAGSRSERFQQTQREIIDIIQSTLGQEKIPAREIVFFQSMLYDFIPYRHHTKEKEAILEAHLKSKRPTIVLHAIKEVTNREIKKLYDRIIPLLDNTNYLASLITFNPADKTAKIAHNVYLLSLLYHLKKMHIKDFLVPHGINTLIENKLPEIPDHTNIDLRYLELDPIQMDTSLIMELPKPSEFVSYIKEKLAQKDYRQAHYLLAMLILSFGQTGIPVLDEEQLIELAVAYFDQVAHHYRDLYINGPQDYRALLKTNFVMIYLSKFEKSKQLKYLRAILDHAATLIKNDPAQAPTAYNLYYLSMLLSIGQPVGDTDRKIHETVVQKIVQAFIDLPEPIVSWPSGKVMQLSMLGNFDYQLLGLDRMQWNALRDFIRSTGRQIMLQGQHAYLTEEDTPYLSINPQAPFLKMRTMASPAAPSTTPPRPTRSDTPHSCAANFLP